MAMDNKNKDNLKINVHGKIAVNDLPCSVTVIEKYSNALLKFLVKYEESKIDKALNEGHYLEAIGALHIQISEQLRYLLIKKAKGHENIPLDYEDERYKTVLEWVKKLKDVDLYMISYIFKRISKKEWGELKGLNTLRNKFSHSFKERKRYSERQINTIISEAKSIEKRLQQEVSTYGDMDILQKTGRAGGRR